MDFSRFALAALSLCFLATNPLAAAPAATPLQLPPPATKKVDFKQDIQPLLEASCIKCHAHGQKKGSFQIDTRETVLKGGETGPGIVPGNSARSYLIHLVAGADPDKIMPQKGPRLTPDQIGLLRAWIDQGAIWGENVVFRRARQAPLAPRHPPLPKGAPGANPIDLFVRAYLQTNQIAAPGLVDDRRYARRAWFDLIGLPPAPQELREFVTSRQPDKRRQLIKRLLERQQDYAEHWLTFWNDALRNDYRGTGYIDGGRKQITSWLYPALATNMPYSQFVSELINPNPASEGFAKGIVWRGAVNASQTPQMQAAQNISQVFLGINLKCASCHDSFINDWKLADAYGLASVYADEPLEMVRCETPTGQKAAIKFLFPELGEIDPHAARPERLSRLAAVVTNEQNGRLARTIVNRLWARFLGRGLIEPVDEMDNLAWHQDLLDWLATDLADHGYNLKRTIELILTSEAYQYPAVNIKEQEDNFLFRGPAVRRLSAEQFLDSLSSLTGVWQDSPAADFDFSSIPAKDGAWIDRARAAQWIWTNRGALTNAPHGTVYFRQHFELAELPEQAVAVVTCDNSFVLYVNGREALKSDNYQKPRVANLLPHLRRGSNVFAVAAGNGEAGKTNQPAGPAGFWLAARIQRAKGGPEVIVSDKSWRASASEIAGWQNEFLADAGWESAVELGPIGSSPWNLEKPLRTALATAGRQGQIRASLVNADRLMLALGRPNREQVITARPTVATTLQALELTNGSALADFLKKSAERLLAHETDPNRLIATLFLQGVGRDPLPAEVELGRALVGTPPAADGLQDLIWSMAMLPEFQLIY